MKHLLKTTSLLAVALVCSIAVSAQATIKKLEKKKTTTTTTTSKPKTDTSAQTDSSSVSTSTSTQESINSTATMTTTPAPMPTTGTINGHEYVDLGLSVKWATCNVGASSPSDYGDYYAWGETSTKQEYTEANCKTYCKNMDDIAGNPQYDVASANWGDTWRLPTAEEIDELVAKCTSTWTKQGGHKGYKLTGPNGNSIFVPAAGWRRGKSIYYAGKSGYYWGATPDETDTNNARVLSFYGGDFYRHLRGRYDGRSVRPVSE